MMILLALAMAAPPSPEASEETQATDESVDVRTALLDIERKRRLCGPLSAWYVASRLGDDISPEEVVNNFDGLEEGASLAAIAHELNSRGIEGHWRKTDDRSAAAIPDLSLLVVGESHCVVLDHFEGDQAVVFEPGRQSLVRVPTIDFLAGWNRQILTARRPHRTTVWLERCMLAGVVMMAALSIRLVYRGIPRRTVNAIQRNSANS